MPARLPAVQGPGPPAFRCSGCCWLLTLLACTIYVPLFFVNVAWFLPTALLPRGVLAELLARRLPGTRS